MKTFITALYFINSLRLFPVHMLIELHGEKIEKTPVNILQQITVFSPVKKIFSCQMLFVLFSLLYFFNYSCASSHSDGKDESLSFPPKVPSEILAVYELEKNNIISFLRSEFKNKDRFSITNENLPKLGSAMKNLCNLDVKGLLEAMINESGYFLMIFWFLNQKEFPKINFLRTNTLYSLELPLPFLNSRNVGRIFKNFKDFIIQASVNTCLY